MLLKELFKRKSIQELNLPDEKNQLDKTLNLFQLVCLGIGMVIGGGIFVVTGLAAGAHAGPAVTISFALAGLVCLCAGLCYAEFASMINVSGSSYSYILLSFGRFPAVLIGNITVIAYFFGTVAALNGLSSYFVDLLADFNIFLPEYLLHKAGTKINIDGNQSRAFCDLPAFIFAILAMFVLLRRVGSSSAVTTFFVVLKILILALFVIVGSFYIDINNFTPYIPESIEHGKFGISGIIIASTMLFVSFNGFDAVCSAAQEAKNPNKNIPLGVILTISLVTLIYISVAFVLTGIVNFNELCVPNSFSIALHKINLPWFSIMIKIGAISGLISVVIVSIYTMVRIFQVMTSDFSFMKQYSQIDKETKVPKNTTFGFCLFLTIMSFFHDDNIFLIQLSGLLILIALLSVCAAAIFMHYNKPKIIRKFKCPFMPITPSIAIAIILFMLSHYDIEMYISLMVLLFLLSLLIYKIIKDDIRNRK